MIVHLGCHSLAKAYLQHLQHCAETSGLQRRVYHHLHHVYRDCLVDVGPGDRHQASVQVGPVDAAPQLRAVSPGMQPDPQGLAYMNCSGLPNRVVCCTPHQTLRNSRIAESYCRTEPKSISLNMHQVLKVCMLTRCFRALHLSHAVLCRFRGLYSSTLGDLAAPEAILMVGEGNTAMQRWSKAGVLT